MRLRGHGSRKVCGRQSCQRGLRMRPALQGQGTVTSAPYPSCELLLGLPTGQTQSGVRGHGSPHRLAIREQLGRKGARGTLKGKLKDI